MRVGVPLLLLGVAGVIAAVVIAVMRPETRHNQFIDESVGGEVSGRVRVMSSADEADNAFAQLGWAAYAFEFDVTDRPQLSTQLRAHTPGPLPHRLSSCHWDELPVWRRVRVKAARWGQFVGPNQNIVTVVLDEERPRGWMCIAYGDRAYREP